MNSAVSIIIPHFNRTALLKETLLSVQKQTFTNWEVIVVDDQSDSEQWETLQTFSSERVRVKQRISGIKGPSTCRNIGVEEATGEYLIFLDADDLMADYCLQQRVDVMHSHPELDGGVFLMNEFESKPGDLGQTFNRHVSENEWISGFITNENPWNVTCPIWKRDSFLKIGAFDEDLFYMEDPDLHLRALYAKMKFETFYQYPPDCYYRVHQMDETKSSFYYNSILYRIQFYRKLTSRFYSDAFIRAHKKDIKSGVNNLIKSFLYSRKNQFPELYSDLINWMKGSGLYSSAEVGKYRFLIEIGNKESRLLQQLKVKGICYNMLPR